MSKKSTLIPRLNFSWKRAMGITQGKQKIARETGIPMSKAGLKRKIGKFIIYSLSGIFNLIPYDKAEFRIGSKSIILFPR